MNETSSRSTTTGRCDAIAASSASCSRATVAMVSSPRTATTLTLVARGVVTANSVRGSPMNGMAHGEPYAHLVRGGLDPELFADVPDVARDQRDDAPVANLAERGHAGVEGRVVAVADEMQESDDAGLRGMDLLDARLEALPRLVHLLEPPPQAVVAVVLGLREQRAVHRARDDAGVGEREHRVEVAGRPGLVKAGEDRGGIHAAGQYAAGG